MARRLTSEEFVEKARAVHDDRYGYERVVYASSTDKVTITCPEHGDFEQTPNNHLKGAGCAKCSGNARLTTEEFIEKARLTHGDKYSYERAVYTSTMKKVTIICPEHGDFSQTPNHHLKGEGCAKCSGKDRLTTEEFVEKARAVHGSRCGYGRTVYVRTSDKVTITCPEHGDFEQTPANHLQGAGCPACVGLYRPTTEEFISKAREVHGNRYGYDRTVYARSSDKVTITCPEHGDFKQRPNDHSSGKGCAKCADPSLTTEAFVEKAREVHGVMYGYERTVYVSAHHKTTITCPEHGGFPQTPSIHLRGSGCPKCATSGFNPDKQAYLYILLDTETHSRVKIGISNRPDPRLRDLKSRTPFTLERIDLFETPPTVTLQLESFCHSQLESANLTGFDGASEWFKFDGGKLEALRSFIRSCGGVQV